MANFNTHVAVATVASTAAVVLAVNVGLINASDMVWYIGMGIIGGMLPDIDADHSRPLKYLFTALAALSSALVWKTFSHDLALARLVALVSGCFLLVRYPVSFLFQKMTVHRGVFHSLLGATFFGLLVTCGGYYFLKWNALNAWFSGLFIAFGFIVHLCLDELFSVDLTNARMKKSFGTALKLFNCQDKPASALLFIAMLGLLMLAPPPTLLLQIWQQANWAQVSDWRIVNQAVAATMRF